MKTIIIILILLAIASLIWVSGAIDTGTPFGYYLPYPVGYQGSPAQRLGIPYTKMGR